VNCSDVHLALGAEPSSTSSELEAHLRECAACAQFRIEMQRLDEKIRRALTIEIPAQEFRTPPAAAPYSVTKMPRPLSRSKQWALAASVLLAVAVVLVLWGALPSHSLAADVVSHVISETLDEPLDGPIDAETVRSVMKQAGLRLDPIDPSVVFMRRCFIRGRFVPHFVVRTADGLATVIILPNEHVRTAERFEGSGYRGVLIPDASKGSIALLSRANVDLEHYAGEIRHAVHSLPARSGG